MPKAIKSDARTIILRVKSFFEEEARQQAPIIPFHQIYKRISAATGVSEGFISKVVKEGKVADETGGKITTPGKKRKRKTGFINVDSFDQGVIRRKIHEFYSVRKEVPTIRKLLDVLKEEINYPGQRESFRKLLRTMGFRFKKTQNNRKVLMERNEITAWRTKYLQEIRKNYNSPNPLPVVYLDETYIHSSHTCGKCWQSEEVEGVLEPVSKGQRYIIVHSGGENGFVENALLIFKSNTRSGDYHDEMNNVNFKKWLSEKLLPNLKEPSLIVMDNAPYHSIRINKCPNTNTLKREIQEWLSENGYEYTDEMTRPQLLEVVKRNKPEPVYEVDSMLAENGHRCLRLPPYHCDLNPIELIWSTMKRKVADNNIDHKSADIPRLVTDAFEAITVEEWKKHCGHVRKLENEYMKTDAYLDEPFIIEVQSDSDTDSDSDSESDHPAGSFSHENYISGVWPIDHDYNVCVNVDSMKKHDHTYCKPGFE